MKGKIIVIDGMDGTGKATQSKLLYEDLKERGMKVKLFTFPNYDSDSSYFVKKFLKEGYTRDINDPMLHSMYFSIDRAITYANDIKKYYEDGYIIILDRYIIANVICNIHKYDEPGKFAYCKTLSKLENDILQLPIPDMNILLYSNPEINNKLMDNEDRSTRDLNETLEMQKCFYDNILFLYQNNDLGTIIDYLGSIYRIQIHTDDPKLKTKEEIHYKIMDLINNKFELYLDIE